MHRRTPACSTTVPRSGCDILRVSDHETNYALRRSRHRGSGSGGLFHVGRGTRPDQGLVGAATVRLRERPPGSWCIRAGDRALREARSQVSVRPARNAGPARSHLRLLQVSTSRASAIAAADRFIKLHPRHPNVDYAYYLKGLVRFVGEGSILDRFIAKDLSEHDAGAVLQSFRAFEELVQRFPESRYADDSRAANAVF